jgi:hypothetical protein
MSLLAAKATGASRDNFALVILLYGLQLRISG